MPYFGWRICQFRPPSCFKSVEFPRAHTPTTRDDYVWPHLQVRQISDEEFLLPLNALRSRYPFVPAKEE